VFQQNYSDTYKLEYLEYLKFHLSFHVFSKTLHSQKWHIDLQRLKLIEPKFKVDIISKVWTWTRTFGQMSRLSCDKPSVGEGVWYGPHWRGCGCLVQLIGEKLSKRNWRQGQIVTAYSCFEVFEWVSLSCDQHKSLPCSHTMIVNIVEFNYLIFFSIPQ